MASNVTINVSPSPGFCVKSKVTSAPAQTHRPVPISQGLKVFVNIAWSNDVPPPLDDTGKTSEYPAYGRRMELKNERDSPIPAFASDGRVDTDKGARSCVEQTFRAPTIRISVLRSELIIHCPTRPKTISLTEALT